MARGHKKLYTAFMSQKGTPDNPRRRNYLLPDRNRALTHRYYFYLMIVSAKYESILQVLEQEFFLSQTHISNVLTQEAQHTMLQQLIEQEVSVRELARLYPHLLWRFQAVV